jgi:cyclophilin family peptidyl-prolyl cis-trans isomerase
MRPIHSLRRHRFGVRGMIAAMLVVALAGCTGGPASPAPTATTAASARSSGATGCPTAAPPAAAKGSTATATIETPKGTIVIKLEADLGPAAVGNFMALAKCGFYDGVVFHRLAPGFVIQGGDGEFGRQPNVDPARVGTGGPGYEFADDPVTVPYARGIVAMANSGPNTNGSQFFIVLADSGLAPSYSVLGRVSSGMDVVDTIAAMPNTGGQTNRAIDPVPMTKVSIATP